MVIKRKKARRNKTIIVISILLALILGISIVLLIINNKRSSSDPSSSGTGSSGQASGATASSQTTPSSATQPTSSTTSSVAKDSANSNHSFKNALFIGDSRTEGLELYGLIPEATFYTSKGLTVSALLSKPIVKIEEKQYTVPDALKKQTFGEIYIMLGINELGWAYDSIFVDTYGKVISEIQRTQPKAKIYLQSLLPVSKEKSDKDTIFNNQKIRKYNTLIEQLAKDKKVGFVDTYQSVVDAQGFLPAQASTDGIHLTKEYCAKWVSFIKESQSK